MREILFKAKRKDNGKWVCGYLIERVSSIKDIKDIVKNKYSFIHGQKLIYSHNWPDKIMDYEYEVDSETICQYTGLADKNGKKIFESDIAVEYNDDGTKSKRAVSFQSGCWIVETEKSWDFLATNARDIEVIGNIHDGEENHGNNC